MPKTQRKTTSIKVSPRVWKLAKIHCIKKGIELSKLIEDLLKKELSKSGQ